MLTPLRHFTPLPVIHRPVVLVYAVFTIIIAMIDQISLPEAHAAASELAPIFGIDLEFSENEGAFGSDLAEVKGESTFVPARGRRAEADLQWAVGSVRRGLHGVLPNGFNG